MTPSKLEPATDELEKLRKFAKEATIALTGLTSGGGSEFFAGQIGEIYVADIPFCVQRVRERYDTSSRLVADAARRIQSTREQAVRECAEKLDECRADILGKQDGKEPAVDSNLRLMSVALDVAHDAILTLLPTPPLIDRGSK